MNENLLLMMRAADSSSSYINLKRPPALMTSSPFVQTIFGFGKPLYLSSSIAEPPELTSVSPKLTVKLGASGSLSKWLIAPILM